MAKFEDLTGEQFGRLKVISFAGYKPRNDGRRSGYWNCLCQCGKEDVVLTANLKSGKVKSCGCLRDERSKEVHTVHGFRKRNEKTSRLYRIWNCMKNRCANNNHNDYKLYGERGISVCEEWEHDFSNFYNWSIENGYKDNLSIDRIDVNGNYEPSNCKWSTAKEQSRNKRTNRYITYEGETHILTDWSKILGIERHTLQDRIIKYGWSIEKAFTTPVKNYTKKNFLDTQLET